jgi:hypothetical protein
MNIIARLLCSLGAHHGLPINSILGNTKRCSHCGSYKGFSS